MGILAANADERVKDVRISGDRLSVDLMDGRTITVPLVWYPGIKVHGIKVTAYLIPRLDNLALRN